LSRYTRKTSDCKAAILLFPDSEQSPAVYLRDDPLFGTLQLQQHSELRAPTAERAAFYLDAAVAGRQREDGDAHMLYTLHVYQYSVAGKGGGKVIPSCESYLPSRVWKAETDSRARKIVPFRC